MTAADRIKASGPKKILALDGGGIRGMITVEVLAEIESLLRETLKRGTDFVLADYFDFVAGTSTGAIIATCISLGMKMADIRGFYLKSGEEMFDRAFLLKRLPYKYEDEKLAARMQKVFGRDTRLGSDKLRVNSVGTGTSPDAEADLRPGEMTPIYNASSIPSALMFAALNEQDLLCRVFGKCMVGDPIDREVGDLISAMGPVATRLFTYARYNAELTQAGLAALGLNDIMPVDVQQLDWVAHVEELQRVGKAVARKVAPEHFAGFLA